MNSEIAFKGLEE